MTSAVEMSRDYFKREMRVGRRVIFQWNEVERFGEICEDCHAKTNEEGNVIEGVIFTDEQRAASFNLDFVRPFAVDEEENWTNFRSWDEATAWVLRP